MLGIICNCNIFFMLKVCFYLQGLLETCIGLGFSIGPVVGGAFYTLGGFQLPFYVLGTVMLMTLPFNIWMLPSPKQGIHQNMVPTFLMIFKIPAVFIVCLTVAVSSSAWSVLEPTLVIHMKQVNCPISSAIYCLIYIFKCVTNKIFFS